MDYERVINMQRLLTERRKDKAERMIERALERGADIHMPFVIPDANDDLGYIQINHNNNFPQPLFNPAIQPVVVPSMVE